MSTSTMRVVMTRDWDAPADARGDVRHYPSNRAVTLDVGLAGYLLAMGYAAPISALAPDEENLVAVLGTLVSRHRAQGIEPTVENVFHALAQEAEAELAAASSESAGASANAAAGAMTITDAEPVAEAAPPAPAPQMRPRRAQTARPSA